MAVLADISVDLMESTEHVELTGVKASLFCQIGIHILITDGRQAADVSVVPETTHTHAHTHRLSESRVQSCILEHSSSLGFRHLLREISKYNIFDDARNPEPCGPNNNELLDYMFILACLNYSGQASSDIASMCCQSIKLKATSWYHFPFSLIAKY